MKIKTKRRDTAVSEIVGAVLLLAIAIAVFSVIYMNVLSDDGPNPESHATIVGKMETGNAIFEHRRGEGISTDSKVILVPRGSEEDKIVRTVAELLDPATSNGDNIWDIGERLQHPKNLTGWKVEATIIDSETNSIIMWGTLQEGYVEPPFGMGGIWHFNEFEWNGILNEVIDSSGNNNHGTARNGANTRDDSPVGSGRAGYFNGRRTYVEVENSISLNIKDEISIEAWIKPEELNVFIDEIEFGSQKFGFSPFITKISGDVYAIVSEFQGAKGNITLINISEDGKIELRNIHETFGTGKPQKLRPIITHVSGEMYLVAYTDKDTNIHMKTYIITSDGTITYTGKERIFKDGPNNLNVQNRPSIVRVNDNVFAITYRGKSDVGILKTIRVSPDGSINEEEVVIPPFESSSVKCFEPSITKISNNIFAVAYRTKNDAKGIVKTFNISSDGLNINPTGYSNDFDEDHCSEPHIIHLFDETCAIIYRGPDDFGILKTFNISDIGEIEYTQSQKIIDDVNPCFDPWIVKESEYTVAIAYSTAKGDSNSNSKGFFSSIEFASNGSVDKILTGPVEFESPKCFNPIIIKVNEQISAITFTGEKNESKNPKPGELKTIFIGDDSLPVSERGIVKGGAVSLYANVTKVFGTVNGLYTLELPIIANEWNHVVLTYDGVKIRLYCNYNISVGHSQNYSEMPYAGEINENPARLLFGYRYCGLIDEIAIFNRAIPESEIDWHQNDCIGCYEVN